jgi:GxxExxY protein
MHLPDLIERDITKDVIGAFYDVYNRLGFGFLEFVYSLAMERELLRRGRTVGREVSVPVIYRGEILTTQRVDMIVDDRVVVEIKSSLAFPAAARLQTLNYLRATELEVGLVLHFGSEATFYRVVHSNERR